MDKSHCQGCEFYNHRTGFDGATECWMFKEAKLILRKRVSKNQPPPWDHKPEMYPSCYRQRDFVFFEGDRKVW